MPVEFHAAAFRFGHSLMPAKLERWNVDHSSVVGKRRCLTNFVFIKLIKKIFFPESELLRKLFFKRINDEGEILDQYIAGFLNQMPQSVDGSITEEVFINKTYLAKPLFILLLLFLVDESPL